MKKIYALAAGLVFMTSASAQDWTDYMQRTSGNLYQIQQEFNTYWSTRDQTEKGKGYKAFKRWENFAEPRVYPSGDISLLGQTGKNFAEWYEDYQAQQLQQQQQNNIGGKFGGNNNNIIASTTWTAIGPMGPMVGTGNGQFLKSGRLNGITTHPTNTNVLYACAPAGGLWRSYNAGVTWVTNTDNLPVIGCSDLAVDPTNTNVCYLATGDGDAGDTRSIGVLKSLDAGVTWTTTGLTFAVTANNLIRRIIVNPVNSQTVICATNGGTRRTINGGTNWTTTDANGSYDVEFNPGNPAIVYSAGTAFRRSTDGGATWTLINNGIPTAGISRMAIAVTPANTSVVYVLASNNTNNGFQGLYRSVDAGVSFSLMASTPNLLGWATAGNDTGGQGWYDLCVAASPTNSNEIITGGVNVWRSLSGGAAGTWTIYGHWTGSGAPFTHADHHDLEYDIAGNLYNANDGTVYRRNGGTWQEVSGTMNISQIYKVGASALTTDLWISGHQDNGTSIYTAGTYSAQLGGDGMDCFIDRTNNSNKFAEYYSGSFMRSIGGGAYSSCTTGMTGAAPWVTIWKQDPQVASRLYAGRVEMFVTNNQATSWTQLAAMPVGGSVREFAIAPSNNQVIYVLKSSAVLKTTNGGTSWTNVTGSLPVGSAAPDNIAIDPNDPNNAWVVFSGYSAANKVFVTTDGGTTWTNYTSNLPNLPANCIIYQPCTKDRVYVGMDVGVYYRDNTQATWTLYNTGLPNAPLSDFEISAADPTRLIASTYGRGMWRVDLIPNDAPATSFSVPASICSGAAATFSDNSTNNPTSWAWVVTPTLGVTINTPSSQNPAITFANAGTYTVSMVASNTICTGTTYTAQVTVASLPTISITNSVQTACQGNSIAIVASGATTYTWSTGANGATVVVSPTAATVYTVNGSNGNCMALPKTATVNTTPAPTVVVNSPSVCSGNSATLTASGATTYTWSTGSNSASIVVSPTATAVYTITGNTGGACNGINTATVTVNSTPTITVNSPSICTGNSATLTAGGAGTYTWSTGSNATSIVVSPTASVLYTVSGSNGNCNASKISTVTVNSNPTVAVNNATMCSGNSVTLTASGAGSYTWSTGSNATSIVVSPTANAVYTVTGSNGNCSGFNTSNVTVNTTPSISVNSASICSGTNATLTANGAGSYTWSTGSNATSIVVSPTANAVYTVNGSNGNCSALNTSTVSVTASPSISVNNAAVCNGNSATLTANGAPSYTWSTGSNATSIVVSPSVTTVYTVSGSNGNCNASNTATVTINTTPTVIIAGNNQNICSGNSTTISASGAVSYLWNTGSNATLITVSPSVTTVYTVTGLNGGCSDAKTATISVSPSPTVNVNAMTICAGSNAVLSASGAVTYTWSTGANTSSITVSPSVTTIYTVNGSNGNCASSKAATVNVNPLPAIAATPNSTLICRGEELILTGNGGVSYTWQPGNLNGTPVSYTPVATQIYTISGTDANNCTNTQTIEILVTTCTGILNTGSETVKYSVYPNPTSDKVMISFPSSMNTELSIEVFDAAGRIVISKTGNFSKTSTYKMDVSELAKGVYQLKLSMSNGRSSSVQLIKQ